MPALSANSVLRIWEDGLEQPPLERALTILRHSVRSSAVDPADLTLPERDRQLFEARDALFGQRLPGYASCPHCTEPLEFDLMLEELSMPVPPVLETDVAFEGGSLLVRLPTSRDLAVCTSEHVSNARETELLARCIVSTSDLPSEAASAEARRALAARARAQICDAWDALAPGMHTELRLHCLRCEHSFSQDFDIATFLWTEVSMLARRLLREVAELAHAYKWRESDILAMSARRRHAYLELVGS